MQPVPENRKVSAFLVFYIIVAMQVGIGILGFQRIIAQTAGYDAWISVILAGIATHFVVYIIYKQLEMVNGDLADVHQYIFGKWIGGVLNCLFILYFTSLAITTIRTYIEVVQVWVFPDLKTFWFALFFLLLAIYIVYGGFRTVTGIAFLSLVLPSYIVLVFLFALPYADFLHFLPLFDHSVKDIILASHQMSLTYLGYESLLFFYPFIQDPKKSKKWAHLGLLFTMVLYLYVTIITFSFYSEVQLQHNIWATLTTFKIVHLPVVERFEYIGIANWCLVILPNFCVSLWCATRIIKRTFHLRQRKGIIILSILSLIIVPLFKTREHINALNTIVGQTSFVLNFIYIPFILLLLLLAKKVKKN